MFGWVSIPCAHVLNGARHFEVINIHHEQQFPFVMPVHAVPIRNRGEPPSNQISPYNGIPSILRRLGARKAPILTARLGYGIYDPIRLAIYPLEF